MLVDIPRLKSPLYLLLGGAVIEEFTLFSRGISFGARFQLELSSQLPTMITVMLPTTPSLYTIVKKHEITLKKSNLNSLTLTKCNHVSSDNETNVIIFSI